MGKLRDVLADIEAILVAQGCARSEENFTLDRVPSTLVHKAYTFGGFAVRPQYLAGNRADWLGAPLTLLISWAIHGAHNSAGTAAEGFLDCVDLYEALEVELVKNQAQNNDENNVITEGEILPLTSADEQDFLLLRIVIAIDAIDAM